MHRGWTILLGWEDEFSFSKEVFMSFEASSNLPTGSLYEQFCLIWSTFSDEEALYAERSRTLWNTIVIFIVSTVDKRSIGEEIGQFTLTTGILQDYLAKKLPARGFQIEEHCSTPDLRALRCCSFKNGAYEDELWLPRSTVAFAGRKAMCAAMWTQWLQNCQPRQVPKIHPDFNCWRASVCFRVSMLPDI